MFLSICVLQHCLFVFVSDFAPGKNPAGRKNRLLKITFLLNLKASYCFLLSFFTFVSFFYKAKPSMKTAHTEITFLLFVFDSLRTIDIKKKSC